MKERKKPNEQDRQKQLKMKNRPIGWTAGIILAFVLIIFVIGENGFLPVSADKNKHKTERAVNGAVVIADQDYNWEDHGDQYTTKRWEGALNLKKQVSDLYLPSYLPKGYEFVQLNCELADGSLTTSGLVFRDKKENALSILQLKGLLGDAGNEENVIVFEGCDTTIMAGREKVYIGKSQEELTARFLRGDYIISLSLTGNKKVSSKAIRRMVQGLQ